MMSESRTINCEALRTLHDLQLKLRRHINDLMAIECEDALAADAITVAVESAKKALEHARTARQTALGR
jgi:hypothetical protein